MSSRINKIMDVYLSIREVDGDVKMHDTYSIKDAIDAMASIEDIKNAGDIKEQMALLIRENKMLKEALGSAYQNRMSLLREINHFEKTINEINERMEKINKGLRTPEEEAKAINRRIKDLEDRLSSRSIEEIDQEIRRINTLEIKSQSFKYVK